MAYLEFRPTQTLFQYTSVDGLVGIVRSKKLRLSDLQAGNDPREIHLGLERVLQALRTVFEEEPGGPRRGLLGTLVNDLAGYFDRAQVFSSCFSLADDELPMWSAYGQQYAGVSLGFRPSALLGIPARVQRVKYLDPAKEAEEFRNLALGIAAGLGQYARSNDLLPFINAGTNAITAVTALKHAKWGYEREVRIVYVQRKEKPTGDLAKFPATMMPGNKMLYWREPLVRTVGERSVSYVEFPFGRVRGDDCDSSRALKSVTLGPNCALTVAEVEGELKEQGYLDCVVQKSTCQIRV